MTLTIEFYGIPRQRVHSARCTLELPAERATLRDVLAQLADRYPALAEECIRDGVLTPGYTANQGGERFISDPQFLFRDGDELLILSADAGG